MFLDAQIKHTAACYIFTYYWKSNIAYKYSLKLVDEKIAIACWPEPSILIDDVIPVIKNTMTI